MSRRRGRLPRMAPTYCLAMIVRDEEQSIPHTLLSVRHMIDRWVIVDTGSVDDTEPITRELLAGVPGEYLHREWLHFAHNRTELLQLVASSGCDYALMLDADLLVEGELPLELHADAGHVLIDDRGFSWRLPLITRIGLPWRYEGVTHSYLACDQSVTSENVDTFKIIPRESGRDRDQKIRQDVELLEAHLEENPDDPRSVYYLAQSYKDLGELQHAADLYGHRATLGGWDEEVFHARYREGQLRLMCRDQARGVWALLEAWSFRPSRAEPLRTLALFYEQRGDPVTAAMFTERADRIPLPADRLFVETSAYAAQPEEVTL